MQTGVPLVGETGKALDAIVHEVQEINQHVDAIAEAAREQSTGLHEINMAVNTMDQGTQKNAAMVEESTAASHKPATEAATLNNLLDQFKLTGTGGFSATVAGVPPPTAPGPFRATSRRAADRSQKGAGPHRHFRITRPSNSPARALGQKPQAPSAPAAPFQRATTPTGRNSDPTKTQKTKGGLAALLLSSSDFKQQAMASLQGAQARAERAIQKRTQANPSGICSTLRPRP